MSFPSDPKHFSESSLLPGLSESDSQQFGLFTRGKGALRTWSLSGPSQSDFELFMFWLKELPCSVG